ncbi:hypothetical protein E2C01_061564 [Portunus trituberculatus]|uniref:Uncharacterized protein n=1 Tax=Portunus trituberculatus TaxID=210409 RepID=A0A5B7HBZ6_PORTR|nr:hypothetical protein [Portunus trituberculatus]
MLRSALARLFITHERNDNKLEAEEWGPGGDGARGGRGGVPCIKRLISTQRPRVPSIRPGLRLQGKPGYRGLSAIYGAESLIRYRYGGGGGGGPQVVPHGVVSPGLALRRAITGTRAAFVGSQQQQSVQLVPINVLNRSSSVYGLQGRGLPNPHAGS